MRMAGVAGSAVKAFHPQYPATGPLKLGANDYLSKPFEVSRLIACVTNILASCAMQSDLLSLKRRMLENTIDYPIAFEAIKTRSSKMRALFQYTEVVACSTQPILITGETGVGKELVAHALHRLSCVAGQMICINVAGLDDATFSDTLFGHTKGAFTGAESAREGLVARAAGGTLILDEIGDMDERSQIKLLRLLQEGEYYPIGSDRLHKTTARVVAVTNQNLRERVTEKQFRKDLYYRLCIHEIHIPPLRDRYEDIPLLLEHFLQEAAQAYHKKPPSVTVSATSYLLGCCFPGNIRELKAMIFDAVARNSEADLTAQSFGGSAGGVTTVLGEVPLSNNILHEIDAIFGHFPTFHEIQSYLIDEALLRSAGNLNVAADMLGITRQTISNRIKSSGSPVKTTKSKVLSKPTT